MREQLARFKLVKQIVAALNRMSDTRARGASVYEFAFTDEPDITAVTRGRAVFLAVTLPTVEVSADRLARLNSWYAAAHARCAVVDSVAGALSIVAETAALAAYEQEQVGEYLFESQY